MTEPKKTLLLVDGSSYLYRAFHAMPDLRADPGNPHFSLSFGGEAFFVIGLHPRASRPARRFCRPVLVFNLHDQFERLREQGRYERMREKIMARDEALAGSPNPMLARHGEGSAARGLQADQGDNSAPWSGAAYLLRRTASGWRQQTYIKPSNTLRHAGGTRSVVDRNSRAQSLSK